MQAEALLPFGSREGGTLAETSRESSSKDLKLSMWEPKFTKYPPVSEKSFWLTQCNLT